jgi:hypothetical protein
MVTLTAAQLSQLVNGYKIHAGQTRTITLAGASKLATLGEVTVRGTLLGRELVRLDPTTNTRTARAGGQYHIETNDGDLHFCLGTKPLHPHIGCELQNATASLGTFKKAVGQTIAVTGFFRCLFEHPGFMTNDDAHIFEIHPVRAVTIGGKVLPFDVDIPDQVAIHTWTDPHPVGQQDERVKVTYATSTDTLVFSGMDGQDENYIRVSGTVSDVRTTVTGEALPSFTLTSPEVGHPLRAYCLPATSAARQLQRLATSTVSAVVLRNIDLTAALKGRYVINVLAIDLQAA